MTQKQHEAVTITALTCGVAAMAVAPSVGVLMLMIGAIIAVAWLGSAVLRATNEERARDYRN
ncbi:hypothetical protein INN71_02805 [Nocardioides sp. ChNu-153]|uniref:hypothetical protein n=1 Tax=Nocardioides sp. ChNu-153 TaxID=2779364 RepID=UPI002656E7FB|nr:hypothetical protein [Nocardioides sp. ChNu-153]MDN7120316.1 hypothetical protein [Nocardioides sp. ChNu-153]